MFKYKVGDEIQVTMGSQKAKKGKIEKVFLKEGKVIVGGVNVYKRHKKVSRNQAAGIHEIARPMNVSMLTIICPKCKKPTRVGFEIEGKIKKRVCKKCKGTL